MTKLLENFTENREKRRTRWRIEKQIKIKRLELKENLVCAKSIFQTAMDVAREYQTRSFFGVQQYHQPPLFTPKELMTIELRIKETTVKSEAVKLQKILNVADYEKSKNLSEILSSFTDRSERSAGAEQNSPRAQSEDVSISKNEIKSEANGNQIREGKIEVERPTAPKNKTENHNQERGR